MDLSNYTSKYFSDPRLEIENYLIMNEYPSLIGKKISKVSRLLELGIGHGFTIPIFNQFCYEHDVIEGSNLVIQNFKTKYPANKCKLIESYFEDFDTDIKYDVIVVGFVLEHVENPIEILRKYKAFLTNNGSMFIAVPNAMSLNRRLGLKLGMINNIYDLNETDHSLGHLRNYCVNTLEQDIAEAGLKIIEMNGLYLKPLPLSQLKMLNNFTEHMKAFLELGYHYPELSVAILAEVKNI